MKRTLIFTILLLISSNQLSTKLLAQNSLEEKIGQMIMTGFPNEGSGRDSLNQDIQSGHLGNVLVFASNLENPTQIKQLTAELQQQAITPLLIGVDQEGGIVARLDEQNGYFRTPNAAYIGRFRNSESQAQAEALKMGNWLKDAGLNFNLAPVADVNVNPSSPAIGGLNRSYSSDENVVYNHVKWATDAYHSIGIATALKHYPGHGSAQSDSHLGFTDISTSWEERELTPYVKLIESGYEDAIMTGHLFKEDWDATWPASLSKKAITDILRDSLGFKGLVISDELFMRAIKDNFGFDEAVIQAIKAGTDILLFSTNLFTPDGKTERESLPKYIVNLVKKEIEAGNLDLALIDAAYNRVMQLKEKRLLTPTSVPEETVSEYLLPKTFQLTSYPNPFNPTTTIKLSLGTTERVDIEVFNTLGRKMLELSEQRLSSGEHSFTINATNWPSGIYIVRARTSNRIRVQKITLLK